MDRFRYATGVWAFAIGTMAGGSALGGTPPTPSLYERLGGTYAIAAVIDDFVERIEVDPVLEENRWIREAFAKVDRAGLKFRITSLVCQAAGGPEKYTGRGMRDSHKHLYVREEDWTAVAGDLKASLDRFNVPAGEQGELLSIVGTLKKEIVLKGALDGKTYAGVLARKAGGTEEGATFGFLASHAESDYFTRLGFETGLYTSSAAGKSATFEVAMEGPDQGQIAWKGTAESATLEAVGVLRRRGRPDEEWVFRGNEVKPAAKEPRD